MGRKGRTVLVELGTERQWPLANRAHIGAVTAESCAAASEEGIG
jgi:hypothetical protein